MLPDEPTLEASLDEWLSAEVPVEPLPPDAPEGTEPEVAAPEDADLADRLLYRWSRLADEERKVRQMADARRARIEAWEADMTSGIERDRARVERSLEKFIREFVRKNPRRGKSMKLPNGTLKLTAPGRGKIVVEDEHGFVAWAKEHRPDLLVPQWVPAKALLHDEDGIPRHPGVQRNDERTGRLVQTYRLMAEIDGTEGIEQVSIPGVVYTDPVQDKFTIIDPNHDEQENDE